MSDTSHLSIDDLVVGYGQRTVLRGVSLTVEHGSVAALTGDNGAGKTTALKAVMGIVDPRSGTIQFDGADLTPLSVHERVRRGIAYVPGDRRLLPELTVSENLRLAAIRCREDSPFPVCRDEALAQFPELRGRLAVRAGELSGGQQQMLAIAKGLITDPDLLLLDEPLEGIAPDLCDRIVETIASLKDAGLTTVLVEHEFDYVTDVVDTEYFLERGTVQTVDADS